MTIPSPSRSGDGSRSGRVGSTGGRVGGAIGGSVGWVVGIGFALAAFNPEDTLLAAVGGAQIGSADLQHLALTTAPRHVSVRSIML